jgi:hypothetical protein
MRFLVSVGLALALVSPPSAVAQTAFHSVQSANLPTAEILPRGSWLFEISHRFDAPFSNGSSDLWGLDGPAYNRLGLSYVVHERAQLGILRSNIEDNVELNAKVGVWSASGGVPLELAVMGGVAFNTQVFEIEGAEDNEVQLYAQLILNALLGERFAVGVVPTLLHNQRLRDVDAHQAVAVGVHGQLYVSPSMSVLAEWLLAPARAGLESDPATFGLEFETRGHFFKLLVTNQARLNPTQFLAGTPTSFEPDEWRFGFNITRLLPF